MWIIQKRKKWHFLCSMDLVNDDQRIDSVHTLTVIRQ
jgi:hypothetical protein